MHSLKFSTILRKLEACQPHPNWVLSLVIHRKVHAVGNTIDELLQHWKSVFVGAEISEPEASIQHLMGASLQCSTGDLRHMGNAVLTAQQLRDLERRCLCRLQRMPVQYIVGEWEFCDVTVSVRPPVLVPRPETERLALLAADRLRPLAAAGERSPRLLEVGCGSGVITLAVLHWLKQVSAVAVDPSEAACLLTEENAARLGVSERLHVHRAALTDAGLPCIEGQRFDMVVSNPPYVPTADLRRLQPEILLYEDRAALDGGRDGLALVRRLLRRSAGWLRPGGRLLLELGLGQPETVVALLSEPGTGLTRPQVHRDFTGRERFVEAQREQERGREDPFDSSVVS
ncbi:MTRF1L release factor glutamine methyltransferase-like isoform X2 [Amphibalanus amphitrite]|nr:MTRF1L release factor glutamine methyltransferase-like isoform X2 [Amphibalanus amphitrite]